MSSVRYVHQTLGNKTAAHPSVMQIQPFWCIFPTVAVTLSSLCSSLFVDFLVRWCEDTDVWIKCLTFSNKNHCQRCVSVVWCSTQQLQHKDCEALVTLIQPFSFELVPVLVRSQNQFLALRRAKHQLLDLKTGFRQAPTLGAVDGVSWATETARAAILKSTAKWQRTDKWTPEVNSSGLRRSPSTSWHCGLPPKSKITYRDPLGRSLSLKAYSRRWLQPVATGSSTSC